VKTTQQDAVEWEQWAEYKEMQPVRYDGELWQPIYDLPSRHNEYSPPGSAHWQRYNPDFAEPDYMIAGKALIEAQTDTFDDYREFQRQRSAGLREGK
jgi:hypothetical protein